MTDAAPVRVAYICGEFPRATDTFIQSEVAGLGQHGGRVVGLDESPTPVGLVASDPRTRTRTIVSKPTSVGH